MHRPTYAYELEATNRKLLHIPGDYGWPLLGKTIALFRNPVQMFDAHYRRYGEVSRISITGQKAVLLIGPEMMKELLLDPQRNYSTKMGWSVFMSDFFAGGVLMRDFEEHRQHRRIMQTAFKSEAMAVYVEQLNSIVQQHVAEWASKPHILFFEETKRLLLHIAFEIFCKTNQSRSEEAQVNQAFIDMMEGTMGIVRKDWPLMSYHRGMNGRRFLENYFMQRVAEKRHGNDQDIFSHFCREKQESGEYFSERDIANHMVFLMLAAHDTTTSAITMAAYHLAHDPNLQQQLCDETRKLSASQPSYSDIQKNLPLTEAVFHETIRLYPAVSIIFRRSIRECTIGGVRIPPHTMLVTPVIYNHRLRDAWQQPDDFIPQRFLSDNPEHKRHAFAWAPFGGGAHKCIGVHFADLLFKCTFAEIMKNYECRYAKSDYYPAKLQYFPFVKPADDLPLTLAKRGIS